MCVCLGEEDSCKQLLIVLARTETRELFNLPPYSSRKFVRFEIRQFHVDLGNRPGTVADRIMALETFAMFVFSFYYIKFLGRQGRADATVYYYKVLRISLVTRIKCIVDGP